MDVEKSQRILPPFQKVPGLARQGPALADPARHFGLTFGFFGYCKNTWHFEVLLLFLRLRYGANLCRSWLVKDHSNWRIL